MKEEQTMNIEVIGPGCYFCKRLYRSVKEVVEEKGINADVKHITDFKTFIKHFPFTPVLLVDGERVHRGKILPKKNRIAELLTSKNAPKA
jgi:small redox-active disulfide protein 2